MTRITALLGTVLTSAALAAALPAAAGEPAEAAARATGERPASTESAMRRHDVTLLTGDRFTLFGVGTAVERVVLREPARSGVSIHRFHVEGRLHLVPSDALRALGSGRLDLRLFDVTALIESGYDDQGRRPLGLVVTGAGGLSAARVASRLPGVRAHDHLPAVDGVALRVGPDGLNQTWVKMREQIETGGSKAKVWLDEVVPPSLDSSREVVGAKQAWDAGFDGSGHTVAVLDTGIDADHPDLTGKVAASADFTGEGLADTEGHGTHVASTIAGSGTASNGAYRGVAPGARLLGGKVCGSDGCMTSAIIAGMEWAAEQGARVVNLSLGGFNQPGLDPMEQAVEHLSAKHDMLFVAAVGNLGGGSRVSSPASAPSALAVGAITDDRAIAPFSSRGDVDGLIKPELVAPGVSVTAARSGAAPGDGSYQSLSGTSMAAPHVAAAAAILAQRHPEWSAAQLKAGLIGAAAPLPGLSFTAQGAGAIDLGRAVHGETTAEPGAVGFGRMWDLPDKPATRTITYRNSGLAPVTLQLRFAPSAADGSPAPVDMFKLSTDSVIVPSGGSAEVRITVDPRADVPLGYVGGQLVATGGNVPLSTPVGILRDAEAYDVTLRQVPRAGEGPANFYAYAFGLDRASFAYISDVVDDDGAQLRLAAGRHLLVQGIVTAESSVLMVQPELTVRNPGQVAVADGRKAKPIQVSLPDPKARLRVAEVATSVPKTFVDDLGGTSAGYAYLLPGTGDAADPFGSEYFGQAGPDRDYGGVTTDLATTWSHPRADGSLADSPQVYYANFPGTGRAFTGLSHRVRIQELATVTASYAKQAEGARGGVAMVGDRNGRAVAPTALEMSFPLPFQRVEHYNDAGMRWHRHFAELAPGLVELSSSVGQPTQYEPPRRYSTSVNAGVFGPSVANPLGPNGWATRLNDTLVVRPPTFADGRGRIGDSSVTTSESTTLYRDGVVIAEAPRSGYLLDCEDLPPAAASLDPCPTGLTADVPAGEATYRLVVAAERGSPHTLSTRVVADWTFRSVTVTGDQPRRLPLSTLRFAPRLDVRNTAPAGRAFTVPIVVETQGDSAAGGLSSLDVDVSYDDGASWWPAQTAAQNSGRFLATARHPDKSAYVSLRANGVDSQGNTVTQTVIRAYRIG